ncbi:dihydropteroate synthase [Tessaracoccus caeni]|uniref:dihydropteroate synthase n=1 Tax=Tessaracoccus caeni TaxID=3031239 RepID=UPI0023DAEA24|nr:dihydropteroate synthase [Tessaracoccus caeni]MDF1487727.1 dihydropteroate synthase [Tessaracoccus caeni]
MAAAPVVMGIVNVTPDSFSDGGHHLTFQAAVAHGRRLLADGASIVDVGGESTRPGADRVPAAEEQERVLPVIAALAGDGAVVSVDTMRASTAAAAIAEGARIVNDVSGGLADPDLLPTVAPTGADVVLMHWRAHSRHMQDHAGYGDVVAEVLEELLARRDAAVSAGIAPERIILDPGLGFAKTPEHNWALLRRLDRFQDTGHRILVGASRKRFLGELLDERPPSGRDAATATISAWCALHGVWGVRTHEVRDQLDAIAVAAALSTPGRAPRSTVG